MLAVPSVAMNGLAVEDEPREDGMYFLAEGAVKNRWGSIWRMGFLAYPCAVRRRETKLTRNRCADV